MNPRAYNAMLERREQARRIRTCHCWEKGVLSSSYRQDGKEYCSWCDQLMDIPALAGLRSDIAARRQMADDFINAVVARKPWWYRMYWRLRCL